MLSNKVLNYDSSSRVIYCNEYKAMNLTHSQNLCTRRHIFADSFSHMFQGTMLDDTDACSLRNGRTVVP